MFTNSYTFFKRKQGIKRKIRPIFDKKEIHLYTWNRFILQNKKMKQYEYAQLDKAAKDLLESWKNLVYVAGASASGKTFIAEQLAKKLEEAGKKVLMVSSDNYYWDDSGIQSVIYGTYDHPNLIEYGLLAQHIDEFFQTGTFHLPIYSFAESRRVGYKHIKQEADILIVEWLYTISQLPKKDNLFSIYIDSAEEDLIVRRLLRDPVRVWEPLHMVVNVLNNVFPMWNLYGKTQKDLSDMMIINDYDILAKDGEKAYLKPLKRELLGDKKLYNTEEVIEYTYDDSSNDANGKLLITEHYQKWFLKSVGIVKIKSDEHEDTMQHISMRIYKPGILTQLHNLFQNAWLRYEWVTKYTETIYLDENEKKYIVSERADWPTIRYPME